MGGIIKVYLFYNKLHLSFNKRILKTIKNIMAMNQIKGCLKVRIDHLFLALHANKLIKKKVLRIIIINYRSVMIHSKVKLLNILICKERQLRREDSVNQLINKV